jgi:hypothetical protein
VVLLVAGGVRTRYRPGIVPGGFPCPDWFGREAGRATGEASWRMPGAVKRGLSPCPHAYLLRVCQHPCCVVVGIVDRPILREGVAGLYRQGNFGYGNSQPSVTSSRRPSPAAQASRVWRRAAWASDSPCTRRIWRGGWRMRRTKLSRSRRSAWAE